MNPRIVIEFEDTYGKVFVNDKLVSTFQCAEVNRICFQENTLLRAENHKLQQENKALSHLRDVAEELKQLK